MQETCYTCDAPPSDEYAGYCNDCRAALVLPCACGGTFDRSPARPTHHPYCHDCGSICAYYDDDDLIDPTDLSADHT